MLKKEQIKLDAVMPELMALVAAHQHDAAFTLLEKTLGSYETRGWGCPMAGTVDLMRRIMALCPGDDGVFVAVKALCGDTIYDQRRKYWIRARYEQDLDQARDSGFVKGIQIVPSHSPCSKSGDICGSYFLADAPIFPPSWCNSEFGCTCGWLNIFEDEDPPTPWRLI